jgi:hypothetical protein
LPSRDSTGGAGQETRELDGRTAQVSFWNYRTLEGHVEASQRDYEVWKWHASAHSSGLRPLRAVSGSAIVASLDELLRVVRRH